MTLTPSAMTREAGPSQPARRPSKRRLSASHLLIAAVVILAFVLNLLALQDRDATTLVAVANQPLVAGSTFSSEAIRLVPVAEDFEGIASLIQQTQIARYEGWIVERSVAEGGLIHASMLNEPGAPSGLRSMSIPVAVEHAAGGTVAAGDRVDIISVRDGVASFVIAGVEVTGVSQIGGGSIGVLGEYHVVVAVDAPQALALAEAIDSGSVEIIRSTGAPDVKVGAGADDS